MTLKWRRTVLLLMRREGASATVVVCYDKRAQIAILLSYIRPKFAAQHVDFWRPCKTSSFRRENKPASERRTVCVEAKRAVFAFIANSIHKHQQVLRIVRVWRRASREVRHEVFAGGKQ